MIGSCGRLYILYPKDSLQLRPSKSRWRDANPLLKVFTKEGLRHEIHLASDILHAQPMLAQ